MFVLAFAIYHLALQGTPLDPAPTTERNSSISYLIGEVLGTVGMQPMA
jgi:hypothetical protein